MIFIVEQLSWQCSLDIYDMFISQEKRLEFRGSILCQAVFVCEINSDLK